MPLITPSLNLEFTKSQQLDPRITFTRASAATRFNKLGLIESVPTGAPRFDFDPITKECLGLLIEEARTNLLTTSGVSESSYNCTVSNNSVMCPNGLVNGNSIKATVAGQIAYSAKRYATFTPGVTYTYSNFVKKSAFRYVLLSSNSNQVFSGSAVFDLDNGTVASGVGTIQAVGDGWFRCSVTGTCTVGGPQVVYAIARQTVSTHANAQYDGQVMLYEWGAQLEQGLFVSSYIPTGASAATRAADVTNVNQLQSWYSQESGTFLCDVFNPKYSAPRDSILFNAYGIGATSWVNNSYHVRTYAGSSMVTAIYNANANQYSGGIVQTARGALGLNKVALAYAQNNCVTAQNGNVGITDTTVPVIPRISYVGIGHGGAGLNSLNGWVKSFKYFPERLSNAEIQTLTA